MRDVKREEQPTDLACEKCGTPMVIKWGRAASSSPAAATRSARTPRTSRATTTARSRSREAETHRRDVRRSAAGRCRCASAASASSSAAPATRSARHVQPLAQAGADRHRTAPTAGRARCMERRSRRGKIVLQLQPLSRVQVRDLGPRRSPSRARTAAPPFVVEKMTKRCRAPSRRCLQRGLRATRSTRCRSRGGERAERRCGGGVPTTPLRDRFGTACTIVGGGLAGCEAAVAARAPRRRACDLYEMRPVRAHRGAPRPIGSPSWSARTPSATPRSRPPSAC